MFYVLCFMLSLLVLVQYVELTSCHEKPGGVLDEVD
jgi:hypothetical protein